MLQTDAHRPPLRHAEDEAIGFVSDTGPIGAFPPGNIAIAGMAFDAGMGPTLENFQFLLDSRGPAGAAPANRCG